MEGRFVSDLSVDEESFLRAAILAEQKRENTVVGEARREGDRRRGERVIAAEARYSGDDCPDCGKD
jgi:hypothetical protein